MKKDSYTEFLQDYDKADKDKRIELEREIRDDIRNIVSHESGKRFVWWLLSISGVFVPSYTGNSDTYFNEGRRAIGLEVIHRLAVAAPDQMLEMMRAGEARNE